MNLVGDLLTYVRRIIKTPSNQSISDATILDYVNRFYIYDAPAVLQLFELKTKFNLQAIPNVDRYNMPYIALPGSVNGNLQFQNLLPPVYVDGVQINMSLSRDTFFKAYPNYIQNSQPPNAIGNGGTNYDFFVSSTPITRGHIDVLGNLDPGVYISCLDGNSNPVSVTDSGLFLATNGNIGTLTGNGSGTVNYLTGEINVTFNTVIPVNNQINIQFYPYAAGTPRLVLFYNNVITLRPVPDTFYLVEFDAYLTPTAFLSSGQALQFGYMSEWLARGAARKILSDTGDVDQFNFYEPLYREQLVNVLRRTERQNSIERTPTIYTQSQNQFGNWNGNQQS